MTTATSTLIPSAVATKPAVAGIPFARLLVVEARKLVNTRAGRWVLGAALLVALVAVAGVAIFVDDASIMAFFVFAATPLGMILPVIAVLGATSEWSQRTGLTTFALEPRRGRVIVAKLIVSVLVGVVITVAAFAMAAAALAVMKALGSTGSFDVMWQAVLGNAVILAVGMLMASGFAFALLNTPAAIVAVFLVPTAWSLANSLSPWLAERAHWLDTGTAGLPLLEGNLAAENWLHLGVASLIWIAIPLAIGAIRVLRSEIK